MLRPMEDNPLEASASQSSRRGDTMSRQETISLFTKLDNTMSSLVGIISQLAAGQGQSASMASDLRAARGDGRSRPGDESPLLSN